jgi:hypothetical protein
MIGLILKLRLDLTAALPLCQDYPGRPDRKTISTRMAVMVAAR